MEPLQPLRTLGSNPPDSGAHARAAERFVLAFAPNRQSHSKLVRKILKSRGRRTSLFSERLFGEPAWDMLLELYLAELEQQRISIGSLCIGSRVAATTALRWIRALECEGLITRTSDPLHGRRILVRLVPEAVSAMHTYFSSEFPTTDLS